MEKKGKRAALELLSERLTDLMVATSKDRFEVARATRGAVSARTVGSMKSGKGNPTIANIEAVAQVFKLQAWELLIDREAEKERIMGRIFGSSAVQDTDERLSNWDASEKAGKKRKPPKSH